MEADLISRGDAAFAPLTQFALLDVTGPDARAFLHGQLSNDIEHLPPGQARRAGYCSPKGRLLASLLVVPRQEGFMLQLARDIAAPVAKRLTMYVLRSKVKIADAGESCTQFGVWGLDAASNLSACGLEVPAGEMQVSVAPGGTVIAIGGGRYLVIAPPSMTAALGERFRLVSPEWWTLGEVRAGLPLVTLPTQDQFVPQMANLELVGGVDFKKGCYPGQEVVARTQYLGKLKRRMYRGVVQDPSAAAPSPGQDLFSTEPQAVGTIVNAAARPEGGYEFLAVVQSSTVEAGAPLNVGAPDGPKASIAPLPYAF